MEEKETVEAVEVPKVEVPKRKIVIETDGSNIHLAVVEVSGSIELVAILQSVISAVQSGAIKK